MISIFINNILEGKEPVIYGSGEQIRDFIYVEDVVKANICVLDKGDNEVFNIGTGAGTCINSLYKALTGIIVGLKPAYKEKRMGDIVHSYFNIEKSSRVLGWKAEYTLTEGLRKTVAYYRNSIK